MTRRNYQLHQKHENMKVRTETLTKEVIKEGWSLGRRGPPTERRRVHECPRPPNASQIKPVYFQPRGWTPVLRKWDVSGTGTVQVGLTECGEVWCQEEGVLTVPSIGSGTGFCQNVEQTIGLVGVMFHQLREEGGFRTTSSSGDGGSVDLLLFHDMQMKEA